MAKEHIANIRFQVDGPGTRNLIPGIIEAVIIQ